MGACAKGLVLLLISVICATEAFHLQHRPDVRRAVCMRVSPCCPGHVCRAYQNADESPPVAACARTLEGQPIYRPGSRAQGFFCGNQRSQPFGRPSGPPGPSGFQRGQDSRFGGRNFDQSRPRRARSPPSGQTPSPTSRGPQRGFGWETNSGNRMGRNGDNRMDWGNRQGSPPAGMQWGSQADRLNRMRSQQNAFRGQQQFGSNMDNGNMDSRFSASSGPESTGGQFGPRADFGRTQSFGTNSIGMPGFSGQEMGSPQTSGLNARQSDFDRNQASFGSQTGFGGSQQMTFDGQPSFAASDMSSQGQSFSSAQHQSFRDAGQPPFGRGTGGSFRGAAQQQMAFDSQPNFAASGISSQGQSFSGSQQQSFGGGVQTPFRGATGGSFGNAAQQQMRFDGQQSFAASELSSQGQSFSGSQQQSFGGAAQTPFRKGTGGSFAGAAQQQMRFDGQQSFAASEIRSQGQSFSDSQQQSFGGAAQSPFGGATDGSFGAATQQSFGSSRSFTDSSGQSFDGVSFDGSSRQPSFEALPPSFEGGSDLGKQQFSSGQASVSSQGSQEHLGLGPQTQFISQVSQRQFSKGSQTPFTDLSKVSQGQVRSQGPFIPLSRASNGPVTQGEFSQRPEQGQSGSQGQFTSLSG